MSDLAAFLLARIGEDEAAARAASEGPWFQDGTAIRGQPRLYAPSAGPTLVVTHTWSTEAAHILRHDPVRVLREAEAKRKIIGEYDEFRAEVNRPDEHAGAGVTTGAKELRFAVRCLAAIYADHAEYEAEWRPAQL